MYEARLITAEHLCQPYLRSVRFSAFTLQFFHVQRDRYPLFTQSLILLLAQAFLQPKWAPNSSRVVNLQEITESMGSDSIDFYIKNRFATKIQLRNAFGMINLRLIPSRMCGAGDRNRTYDLLFTKIFLPLYLLIHLRSLVL